MDRVRFGRALGRGVRLAARTAIEAADAAASPGPAASAQGGRRPPSIVTAAEGASNRAMQPRVASAPPTIHVPTASAARVATAAARSSFGAPLRRASRALWHEVTGSFFALFALSFAFGAWHAHGSPSGDAASDRHRLLAFLVLSVLLAYFSISSFARARRVS